MKQTGSVKGNVRKAAVGAGIALAVYMLLLALSSLLIVKGLVGESKAGVCVWIAACLAAFAGAKAVRGAGNPAVASAAGMAILWIAIQLIGLVTSDALDATRSLALVLPLLTGWALALIPGRGKKKGERRRRRSGK